MRIPCDWLKEYIEIDLPAEEIGRVLTMGGLEVEQVVEHRDEAGGAAEPVLVTSVTSNRGDLLSVVGTARHLSALTGRCLRAPSYSSPATESPVTADRRVELGPVTVEIIDAEGCPRYCALLIEGIQVGPSPQWMQARLEAAGLRAINNVVDCTNYVMLELGQPLHAFDFHLLADGHVIVRKARAGETLTTLDGIDRRLTPDDLLICDPGGPIALAGVMGGASTEIHAGSTAVLLEAAHFHPATVRKTSLRLGLSTEASYRFERHVDPNLPLVALARVAELIIQTAGGQIKGQAIDVKTRAFSPRTVTLRPARCNALLGTDIAPRQMSDYLKRLGFEVRRANEDLVQVTVPTARPDVQREVDLIEEIAVIHGYDNIPLTIPGKLAASAVLTVEQRTERRARHILRACGLNETISFSMISPRDLQKLGLPPGHPQTNCLSLANPMSEEYTVMRTTLLPSLLAAAQHNINQRVTEIALYEINRVYLPQEGSELPSEPKRVAGLVTGSPFTARWNMPRSAELVDFFWIKGIVEQLCEGLGIQELAWARANHPAFHPGRCARLLVSGRDAGVVGEMSPEVQQNFDLPEKVYAFELDFDLLIEKANLTNVYKPLPRLPAALRDVAVIVPDTDEFSAARVMETIKAAGGEYLAAVEPFDVFTDPKRIGPGRRSLAFSLQFRAPDRALTSEEVEAMMEAIYARLEKELGAEVRKTQ